MGDPSLLQVCRPVTAFGTVELTRLVDDMIDTMRAANGAGLAAPQIGVPLRVVIFGVEKNPRYPNAEPVPFTVLINPEIDILDQNTEAGWEGCLSVPGMRGKVERFHKIRYGGFDINGTRIDRTVEGFHARVVQHEVDHLDGILYPQRIKNMCEFGFIEELERSGLIPARRPEAPDQD